MSAPPDASLHQDVMDTMASQLEALDLMTQARDKSAAEVTRLTQELEQHKAASAAVKAPTISDAQVSQMVDTASKLGLLHSESEKSAAAVTMKTKPIEALCMFSTKLASMVPPPLLGSEGRVLSRTETEKSAGKQEASNKGRPWY